MSDQSKKPYPPDLAKKIATASKTDIVLYYGDIKEAGFGKLTEIILSRKRYDSVILILVTNGGSANAAYKIARLLQRVYKDFALYAPTYCYSAGTIVALGAHKLIMGPFSELGPLDVQLFKQNELGARKSGLLARSAFQSLEESSFDLFESFMLRIMAKSGGLISFRVAAEISSKMTTGLMSGIYERIDPDIIGSDQRDLEVALHYGLRLVDYSGNADAKTIYHLVHDYPAHDFVIDCDEAVELFDNVDFPDQDLMYLSALVLDEISGSDDIIVISLSNNEKDTKEKKDAVPQKGKAGSKKAKESASGNVDKSGDSGGQGDSKGGNRERPKGDIDGNGASDTASNDGSGKPNERPAT